MSNQAATKSEAEYTLTLLEMFKGDLDTMAERMKYDPAIEVPHMARLSVTSYALVTLLTREIIKSGIPTDTFRMLKIFEPMIVRNEMEMRVAAAAGKPI